MSLKIHLIIVGIIIFCVFLGWQLLQWSKPAPTPEVVQTDREIEIIRASWGLSCNNRFNMRPKTAPAGNFTDTDDGVIKENNLLQVASALCNLKPQCAIRNSADSLGFDPAPDCVDKQIEIEYRCFSYDRPWVLTIKNRETGVIDCTKNAAP
jgi:hypothetical protein